MAIKIVQSTQSADYDLRGIVIDHSRKTGVLIRQSKKGADLDSRESRLRQESLVPVAVALRGDPDSEHIVLYDEGSGVSGTKGYDQRPQLSRLYVDIANGIIGSIVVARADRLFRDKHFRNVSMFTELAEKQSIMLIVPGRAVYDFTKTRDLQAFQREMQESYNYIATQIAYMQDTRQQKVQRGCYGGANLPAPYAIERATPKEERIPVIYRPWQPITIQLFRKFKELDYTLGWIARYIEDQPYLFPYPAAEDAQRLMFKTRMRMVEGGYTFSSADSIRSYFSNLTLGGYAKIGRDADGSELLLEDAFEAAIPMELLGEAYAAITGRYPDGTPFERRRFHTRTPAKPQEETTAILHGILESDDGAVSYRHTTSSKDTPSYICYRGLTRDGWALSNKVGIMRQETAWCVPCPNLDRIIVARLCHLAEHDGDMAARVRSFWEQRRSRQINEARLLKLQIEKAEAQIRRFDKLLTNPATPLTAQTEKRYIEALREAEADLERLNKKQTEDRKQEDPAETMSDFYRVLENLPKEFSNLSLDTQKRMARKLIEEIRLNIISPHMFILHVTWHTGVASCPDVAFVWRGIMRKTRAPWMAKEDQVMRTLYPLAPQEEVMMALPVRAWNRIQERAQDLNLRRTLPHAGPHPFNVYHRTMSYRDLSAAASLVETPEQQERVKHVANQLAKATMRGGLSAHWWLPLQIVGYATTTSAETDHEHDPPMLYVSALAYGSHRRGGSSCR